MDHNNPKDYYQLLGLAPLINATGTMTALGGSRLHPAAAQAMAAAGGVYIDLEQLHIKAGEYIAGLLGVEAACVTAGAAAGMVLAAAACLAENDPDIQARLPQPPSRCEIIIQCCHRNPFERAFQLVGAQIVQVGDAIHTRPDDLIAAINDRTAAIAHFLCADMLEASLPLPEVLNIALRYGIPVIVDAAAEIPPKSNLWEIARQGADLVIFSGGKDMRGPQTSGLMVGRADLISAARVQTAPFECVAGRPMKASKELVIGFLAALEAYLQEDEEARFQEWDAIAAYLQQALSQIKGLTIMRYYPSQPYIQPANIPRLQIDLAPDLGITAQSLSERLKEGVLPIHARCRGNALTINVHTLVMDEARIIVERITSILHGD